MSQFFQNAGHSMSTSAHHHLQTKKVSWHCHTCRLPLPHSRRSVHGLQHCTFMCLPAECQYGNSVYSLFWQNYKKIECAHAMTSLNIYRTVSCNITNLLLTLKSTGFSYTKLGNTQVTGTGITLKTHLCDYAWSRLIKVDRHWSTVNHTWSNGWSWQIIWLFPNCFRTSSKIHGINWSTLTQEKKINHDQVSILINLDQA